MPKAVGADGAIGGKDGKLYACPLETSCVSSVFCQAALSFVREDFPPDFKRFQTNLLVTVDCRHQSTRTEIGVFFFHGRHREARCFSLNKLVRCLESLHDSTLSYLLWPLALNRLIFCRTVTSLLCASRVSGLACPCSSPARARFLCGSLKPPHDLFDVLSPSSTSRMKQ